jgi:hypothetical protein
MPNRRRPGAHHPASVVPAITKGFTIREWLAAPPRASCGPQRPAGGRPGGTMLARPTEHKA